MENLADFRKDENFYRNLLQRDDVGISPDPAIKERLCYNMSLRTQRQTSQNSLGSIFFAFFSLQNIGLKAAFLTFSIVFSIWMGKVSDKQKSTLPLLDTTNQISSFMPMFNDSLIRWKDSIID